MDITLHPFSFFNLRKSAKSADVFFIIRRFRRFTQIGEGKYGGFQADVKNNIAISVF
jgi:hypothetical protein